MNEPWEKLLSIVSCEHCSWLLASTIVLICRHKMTCFMDFSVPKFLGVQNPGRGEGHQLGGWRWPWDCDHTTKLSRLLRRIIISIWRVFTKILPNNIIKETTKSLVERLQFRRLASSWDEGSLNNQDNHEHPWTMTSKEALTSKSPSTQWGLLYAVKVRPLLGVASLPHCRARLAGRVLITRPKLATKTDWPRYYWLESLVAGWRVWRVWRV